MRLEQKPHFARRFRRLGADDQRAVAIALARLEANPRDPRLQPWITRIRLESGQRDRNGPLIIRTETPEAAGEVRLLLKPHRRASGLARLATRPRREGWTAAPRHRRRRPRTVRGCVCADA